MLKIKTCKKILEANGKKYSEEEVKIIRDKLYKLAQITNDTKLINDEKVGE